MSFEIIPYTSEYENELMELIMQEGADWEIYWGAGSSDAYRKSFDLSITYLVLAHGKVCGYLRSLRDALFIYVCDLLVNEKYRGNHLGEMMLRRLQADYPSLPVYVMSGNDGYYQKIGFHKEGSIFLMPNS